LTPKYFTYKAVINDSLRRKLDPSPPVPLSEFLKAHDADVRSHLNPERKRDPS